MPTGTGTGKGNRRTGSVKGTKGRRGQLPAERDQEVMERVRMVHALWPKPLTFIHQEVNRERRKQGKRPVSYQTIAADRDRALEITRETIVADSLGHRTNLQYILSDSMESVRRTPPGPSRTPLYAVAIRCIEDMARLDGSWEAARQPVLMDAPSAEEFGPSPQELLERGEISQEAYHGFLLVLHRNSGGIGSTPAQALPEPSGDVLEAQAVEVRGGSRPGSVRASTRRAEPTPPLLPRMGDEVDGVVNWEPPDSE